MHDLEIELNDFKEESKIQQPLNDTELKVWNDKIYKKQELTNAEDDSEAKNKEKYENLIRENEKLHSELGNVDNLSVPKISANQLKKVREAIEIAERQIKIASKKNKEAIREKENEVLSAKNELNLLINKAEEVNKIYRINQYRCSQNERTIKYNLYDIKGASDSQLDLTYNSKTGSSRETMSQKRGPHLMSKNNGNSQRERSAFNTRNIGQKGKEFNSSYIGNNENSDGIGRYQANSKNQSNRFKTMKKMNEKVNSSMNYGDKSKNKIDVNNSKQEMTLDNIRADQIHEEKQVHDIKKKSELSDKHDKESKDKKKKTKTTEKGKDIEAKESQFDDYNDNDDIKSKHSAQDSESKEHKELKEVKGLKIGQKKKIETSVNLS